MSILEAISPTARQLLNPKLSTLNSQLSTNMTTRIKKSASQVPVPQNRAQMEALVGQIASLKRDEASQKLRMDKALAKVKADFEESLAGMATELKPLLAAAEAWAASNPDEFGKAKSIKFLHGIIGYRTGTPKLTLLSRQWTWDKVLAAIETFSFQFVRNSPSVDKEAILAFAAAEADKARLDEKVLRPIGVKIVQEESFFVEPTMTEVEKRETVEAK